MVLARRLPLVAGAVARDPGVAGPVPGTGPAHGVAAAAPGAHAPGVGPADGVDPARGAPLPAVAAAQGVGAVCWAFSS